MAILSGLRNYLAQRLTTEPKYPAQRDIPFNGRTQAGVYITPHRALMNDTVWACRRYIAESMGQLPAKIVQVDPRTKKQLPYSAPYVDNLLNYRPNPELAPFQFAETMVGWALLEGNGIAEIELDGAGRPANLWPIKPERIQFLRDVSSGELIYRVRQGADGSTVDLNSSQVFHLRGFGDGAVGLSVAEYAAQTIGYARAAELFGASFFGEGMHFGGTAIFKNQVKDQKTLENVREELNQSHRGPYRVGKWFVGDGDIAITKTSFSPDEGQMLETMQFNVESVCRWFGVPPHKVGHLLRMTFNNVEQMSIDAVGQCIAPWALRMQQEATYKLLGKSRLNISVVYDLKGLLRGDYKTRQEGLQIMRRNGVINSQDWAELEDMPEPKKGSDVYIVEANMAPIDKLEELAQSKIDSTNAPNSQPQNPQPNPEPNPNTNNMSGVIDEEALGSLRKYANTFNLEQELEVFTNA